MQSFQAREVGADALNHLWTVEYRDKGVVRFEYFRRRLLEIEGSGHFIRNTGAGLRYESWKIHGNEMAMLSCGEQAAKARRESDSIEFGMQLGEQEMGGSESGMAT